MEASSGRFRVRPIVVDFLATLFVTFCIGVSTALVLGVCVVLMAGEARGAAGELAPMEASEAQQGTLLFKSDAKDSLMDAVREGAPTEETRAKAIELTLTHHLVTKYTSLIAIDRTPARAAETDLKATALPADLPEGQSYEAIFGGQQADAAPVSQLPQGATNSRFNLLAGALMLLFAILLLWQMQARPLARLLRRGRG